MASVGVAQPPPPSLLSGGGGGQLLTRGSTTGSSQWSSLNSGIAIPTMTYTSGSWYDARFVGDSTSGSAVFTGSYFTPVYITSSVTIGSLAFINSASGNGAGTMFLSVYSANATTGLPALMLRQTSVAFADTNATYTVGLPSNVTAGSGWIYLHNGCSTVSYGAASLPGTSLRPILTNTDATPSTTGTFGGFTSVAAQPGDNPAVTGFASYSASQPAVFFQVV